MNQIAASKAQIFQAGFTRLAPSLKKALPPHITFEKFERVVMVAVQKDPKLLDVDQRGFFLECQKAAFDGLLPDGREGVFVRRWNTQAGKELATWQPMVAGLMKLARNSGEIASLTSQVVYEGEKFHVILGDEERIEHERRFDLPEGAKVVAAYAVARLKDGSEPIREVMTRAQIERTRNVNSKWQKGPWGSWDDEMSRKAAMRRLCKRLPLSTDRDADMRLQQAIERDSTIEGQAEEVRPAVAPGTALDMLEASLGDEGMPAHDPQTGEIVEDTTAVATEEPWLPGAIATLQNSKTRAQMDAYIASQAEPIGALSPIDRSRWQNEVREHGKKVSV